MLNKDVMDDDEELLLLRIKALKSTPRVNISVQFTSDSDNDIASKDVKKKKQHARRSKRSSEKASLCLPTSSNIGDDNNANNDDEESMLRQIALNSLRRRSTEQSPNVVVLKSNNENQTTIQISQNVAQCTTDSVSLQQVIISSTVVTAGSLQESSAIQHDLISSTSEDHGTGKKTRQSVSTVIETTTSSSVIHTSKFTNSNNLASKSNLCEHNNTTCYQSGVDSNSDVDFKAEIVQLPSLVKSDQAFLPSSNIICADQPNEKITNKSSFNKTSKCLSIEEKVEDTQEKESDKLVDKSGLDDYKFHDDKACLDTNSEQSPARVLNEDTVSSASEIDTEIPNSTSQVDIVIQRKFQSVALKDKIIQSEIGKYSPSSPSESDDGDCPDIISPSDNAAYNDDVLSLCTSDKEGSELDSFSFAFSSRTQVKNKTPGKTKVKVKSKKSDSQNVLSTESLASKQIQNAVTENNTSAELSNPNSPANSDQKEKTNDLCLPDKDLTSDASGLNIILDRYLNEVAANRKRCQEKIDKLSDYEEVNDCVDSSNITDDSDKGLLVNNKESNWIDCKPGPSGYMKTIIPDYGSDSDDYAADANGVSNNNNNDNGLLCTTEESSEEKKLCNASNEDIKTSLVEQNINEDGKRDDLKDVTCSICLGAFENRSFLNACFHSFCYMCIIQWSELSRLCPLCKTKYSSLIHSVNTDLDYETYEFPEILPEKEIMPVRREFCETMEDGRRFRYRSTVVDRDEWEARRLERERLEQEYITSQQQRRMRRRLKWSATKSIRKTVYQKDLQIKEVKQRGVPKFRDITPKFFHDNPALKHRLVPWLLRDLNVLLGNEDENIRFVMSLILTLISKVPMKEDAFRDQLRPFLFEKTGHFIAELVSFASSPYDMRGYDKNVRYNKPVNDLEITFSSYPAVEVSDEDSPTEEKEFSLTKEVLNVPEDDETPLLGDSSKTIPKDDTIFESISPVLSHKDNGFEDITPVNRSPINNLDGDHKDVEDKDQPEANVKSGDAQGKEKSGDESSSDDMCNQVRKKNHKEGRKEKKKKRKRKRKHLGSDDDSHKKKKKGKKGTNKRKKIVSDGEIPLSKDPNEEIPKKGKSSETVNGNDSKKKTEKDNDDVKTNHVATKHEASNKKAIDKTRNNHKDKKRKAEQKRRRRHKKKYKYVKHVKHKRKRLKSFSSESEDDDDEKSSKPSANHDHSTKRKSSAEQPGLLRKKPRSKKLGTDDEDDKPCKKSLKRKAISSVTDQERESKRKKKEKERHKSAADVKTKHKKKEKKKRKKYKRRKHLEKKSEKNPSTPATTEACSDKKVDKELRSKIDHAINAIMDTKGGSNSSDDDEFLNSQEVQDLLSKYKYNDKLDLIKDGDAYKTRAEVVQELLLIEKAITRRKEKKKQKQIVQSSKSLSSGGKNPSQKKDLSGKQGSQFLIDKAAKKAEREKSYKVLIKELQEIEGRINSCRSSLQVKPSDMI